MLRHIVLLRFTSPDPELVDRVATALEALPREVPSIRSYAVGRDLGLGDGNAHLAVVAEFDDAAGHAEYRDHPAHMAVIDELIRPNLESRSAIQMELRSPTG